MPRQIYFAGAEDTDFSPVPAVYTIAGRFDAVYVRSALTLTTTTPTGGVLTDAAGAPVAVAELWMGVRAMMTANTTTTIITFFSGSTPVAGVRYSNGGVLSLLLWNGAAWATVATDTLANRLSGLGKLDLHLALAAEGGVFRLYHNGAQILEYVGNTMPGGLGSVGRFELLGSSGVPNTTFYSEVIISDIDTRSVRVAVGAPSANGTHTDGTGSYADIDEVGVSSVDAIQLDGAGQRRSVALTDLPAGLTGMQVAAVIVVASMARGDAGPQTGHLGVRSGGTTDTAAVAALAQSYETRRRKMHLNPVTGNRFTIAEVDALELVMGAEA